MTSAAERNLTKIDSRRRGRQDPDRRARARHRRRRGQRLGHGRVEPKGRPHRSRDEHGGRDGQRGQRADRHRVRRAAPSGSRTRWTAPSRASTRERTRSTAMIRSARGPTLSRSDAGRRLGERGVLRRDRTHRPAEGPGRGAESRSRTGRRGWRSWRTGSGSPSKPPARAIAEGAWSVGAGIDRWLDRSERSSAGPGPATSLSTAYDGLVAFARRGGSEGTQIVPNLAESLPVITNGETRYTFQLRRGVRYSNGALVKASDFRRALERSFRAGADVGDVPLVGIEACTRRPQICDLSRGVQTDDETGTIVFHLRRPVSGPSSSRT